MEVSCLLYFDLSLAGCPSNLTDRRSSSILLLHIPFNREIAWWLCDLAWLA